jgi:hypothetical protein
MLGRGRPRPAFPGSLVPKGRRTELGQSPDARSARIPKGSLKSGQSSAAAGTARGPTASVAVPFYRAAYTRWTSS